MVAIENTLGVDPEGRICSTQYADPHEIAKLVDILGSEHFCSCVDTGHYALTSKDTGISVGDSIRILGNRVKVIHIQEVDGKDDCHTVPFTFNNTMDWDDICNALKEVGFKGPVNFETMSHLAHYPDCPEMNLEAMRHISALSRYMSSKLA